MNRKKLLIIIGLAVFIFLVVFLMLKTRKEPTEKQITPATINVPKNYKGELSFNINISEKDFNFPEALPLIEVIKKVLTKEQIFEVSKKLNFTGEPTTVNDAIDGLTYFWKNEDSTFFSFPESGIIRFGSKLSTQAIDKQLLNDEVSLIAENFLYENAFTKNGSLKLKEIKYLKQDLNTEILRETKREEAEIYECVFNPIISDYEINTSWTDLPLIFVQILKDGSVYSAQFTNLTDVQKSESTYKIKNFQEFENTINESVLVSVKNAQLALSDLIKESIAGVEINKVELIYLQESSKSIYLQPMFKIYGTTSITGFGNGIEVVLYLSAISQK